MYFDLSFSQIKHRLALFCFCLIAVLMVSCQDITGVDNASGGALSVGGLQRSVAAVNAIVIDEADELALIGNDGQVTGNKEEGRHCEERRDEAI